MINNTIEIVAGYQTQDADGYATSWDRTSVGANWFINKHDTKVQLTYRMGENLNGVKDKDEDEVFLQTQFVF
jgi:phosphate-selective porin OprO/OprP